ncbi:MAG: thiamine-phosphate kinase [Terriglobia bacterium]
MQEQFRSEAEFLTWLRRRSGRKAAGMLVGIGDDAGLIRPKAGRELILTTDLSIEGVHFSTRLHPPEAVGHRALARSLSDIAAMGGAPRFALVALTLSRRTDRLWLEKFYGGIFRLARRFGVMLLGGDTATKPGRTGGIAADVVVVGDVARGRALLRSGARPGDAVFVAGTLGLAALGLRALRSKLKNPAAALRAHLYPEPQCALGQFLAEERVASAAMDLSDGLSLDLARLAAASGVGGCLWRDAIPTVKPGAMSAARGVTPLSLALNGGEDYKLLFTVPQRSLPRVPAIFDGVRLHRIGEICASARGISLIGNNGKPRALAAAGYDHFRRN